MPRLNNADITSILTCKRSMYLLVIYARNKNYALIDNKRIGMVEDGSYGRDLCSFAVPTRSLVIDLAKLCV